VYVICFLITQPRLNFIAVMWFGWACGFVAASSGESEFGAAACSLWSRCRPEVCKHYLKCNSNWRILEMVIWLRSLLVHWNWESHCFIKMFYLGHNFTSDLVIKVLLLEFLWKDSHLLDQLVLSSNFFFY
jgi:hypothetical protein